MDRKKYKTLRLAFYNDFVQYDITCRNNYSSVLITMITCPM